MSFIRENSTERFIYFAGVDGCGKSTIIEELIRGYEEKGIKARRVWLRFNYFLTRPVLLLCRIIGLTRREKKGGKVYSIHDFHKSRTIATLVQYLHFIDTVFAYILKVWIPLKTTNDVILCDKFVYDILADFMLETQDPSLLDRNISKLFLKLLPQNMSVIFLTADREEIIRRKPEVLVDDEDYDFKYDMYILIMNSVRVTKIQNINFNDTISKIKEILELGSERTS